MFLWHHVRMAQQEILIVEDEAHIADVVEYTLKEHGYATGAVTGGLYVGSKFGLDAHFDYFEEEAKGSDSIAFVPELANVQFDPVFGVPNPLFGVPLVTNGLVLKRNSKSIS